MAVRIKVGLKPLKGNSTEIMETSALANTGYESAAPQVVVPAKLARRLGFLPKLPKAARKETIVTAIGTAKLQFIPDALEVSAVTSDRQVGPVRTSVIISAKEKEVLLSDVLIDELKLSLVRPGAGLWRFSDDKHDLVRESTAPEEW